VFRWTTQREKAALLIANDEITDDAIAAEVGVSRQALWNWKTDPEFKARVDSLVTDFRAHVRRHGIAIIENRIGHLQRRHDLMNKVIVERAADPGMQDVPGGKTGLMVHNVKSIGSGADAERVDLYEVDTALLKELRDHERQAAQELGQWSEKSEQVIGINSDTQSVMAKIMGNSAAFETAVKLSEQVNGTEPRSDAGGV
jgi:Helix-turn-helix of insertion element transposase